MVFDCSFEDVVGMEWRLVCSCEWEHVASLCVVLVPIWCRHRNVIILSKYVLLKHHLGAAGCSQHTPALSSHWLARAPANTQHMSPEPKWCFLNLSTQDNSFVKGIYVLKSNPFTLWYFCPENGSKRPRNGILNFTNSKNIIWVQQTCVNYAIWSRKMTNNSVPAQRNPDQMGF